VFVGHYAVSLAAKRFSQKTSLGWTFLAVQFLDILWVPAILLGIEHARLLPGFLPASSLVLYDMPWTHSLLMAVGWSWLAFRIFKTPIMGICVFSHWVLDYVVHVRDLPLFKGGPLVGLGLWHYRHLTFLTEAVLLLLGLLIYLQATRSRGKAGEYAMPAFVIFLILLDAVNLYGPPPPSLQVLIIGGEISYFVLALIAGWLDRLREPPPPKPPVKLDLSLA
jgi:hypothetical protein